MKRKMVLRIQAIYASIEEVDPDISTERLLQMTCDEAGVDMETVVTALSPEWCTDSSCVKGGR